MYDAASPWCWMWLRSSLSKSVHLADVLELVERDQHSLAAPLGDALRQLEQGVQRRQRVGAGLELQLHGDPRRAEREPEAGRPEDALDRAADRAFELRIGALDPDRHVRVAEHAVEIDQHGDELTAALGFGQGLPQQARLAEPPRRVEAHEMASRGE